MIKKSSNVLGDFSGKGINIWNYVVLNMAPLNQDCILSHLVSYLEIPVLDIHDSHSNASLCVFPCTTVGNPEYHKYI